MKVLVLGGYGFFGSRVVCLLAREPFLTVVVAGRSKARADAFVKGLCSAKARLQCEQVDAASAESLSLLLSSEKPDVVINTCGPFQGLDYVVARLCVGARCHYIDLADGRAFVSGITSLDAVAKDAGVALVSGASSVPGLSGAVLESLASGFSRIDSVEVGISPGNRTERGLATIRAILSYCGESVPVWANGAISPTSGWTRMVIHRYPTPVGRRLLTDCDVPDLVVVPLRYPGVRNVRFLAGLELPVLHLGLWGLSLLRKWGLLPNLSRYAGIMKRVSEWFLFFGSDAGAMHVRVEGLGRDGAPHKRIWTLLAEEGDGPYVPALCSVAIVRRLLVEGGGVRKGAFVAPALVSVEEILAVAKGLAIRSEVE